MRNLVLVLLLSFSPAGMAQTDSKAPSPFDQLVSNFSYNSKEDRDFRQAGVEMRGKVRVIDLDFAGPDGNRVPAYLLVPPGNGPYPAIIWGHWLMKGSPLRGREEFMDEALVLARAGVVSLLIDAPQVRPGFKEEPVALDALKQSSDLTREEVLDLRRGVDILLGRRDVDPHRIGYVGHSFNAHCGAILAGVDHRISAFVLMAASYSDEANTLGSKDPKIQAKMKEVGEDNLREYFKEYSWDDPINFLGHTDGESIFLQFGTKDEVTKEQGQQYLDKLSAKDKDMKFYDAGHALNAAARVDRVEWLQKRLKFKHVGEKELEAVPQVK